MRPKRTVIFTPKNPNKEADLFHFALYWLIIVIKACLSLNLWTNNGMLANNYFSEP